MNRFNLIGNIDSNGRFRISNLREFKDYCNRHKNKRVVCTFEAIDIEASQAQKAYYRNFIVPKFQKILYKTGETLRLDQVDEMLRKMSVHSIRETLSESGYDVELIPFEELTNNQLLYLIDDLKRIAAQEFYEYIE